MTQTHLTHICNAVQYHYNDDDQRNAHVERNAFLEKWK